MKRKFLTVFFAIVAALCLCFGIAACGESQSPTTNGNESIKVSGLSLILDEATQTYCVAGVDDRTIETVTIPAQYEGTAVTAIGTEVFSNCYELTSIVIPDSVTSIGEWAFANCSKLTDIDIPDGVTSIEGGTFYNCSGLTSIEIPEEVTSIGSSAFKGCSELTNITIPDSVTSIGSEAFSGCSGLESVTIGSGATSIESNAFDGCSGLTSVIIGSDVTSIGDEAFKGCSRLTDIQFKGTVEEWQAIEKGPHWNVNTGNYIVTCTNGTVTKKGWVTYF